MIRMITVTIRGGPMPPVVVTAASLIEAIQKTEGVALKQQVADKQRAAGYPAD